MVWFLNGMKTATIELPDAVFSELEQAAASQHQPLTSYIVSLLSRQAGSVRPVKSGGKEPDFPLIRSDSPGTAYITNELLAEIEAQEDAEKYARIAGR